MFRQLSLGFGACTPGFRSHTGYRISPNHVDLILPGVDRSSHFLINGRDLLNELWLDSKNFPHYVVISQKEFDGNEPCYAPTF
jgi:hypothetical protein